MDELKNTIDFIHKDDFIHKEIDSLSKIVEAIYKKVFILLATAGSTSIVLLKNGFTVLGLMLDIIFIFIALGIFINYKEISKIKNKMKKLQIELNNERSKNE